MVRRWVMCLKSRPLGCLGLGIPRQKPPQRSQAFMAWSVPSGGTPWWSRTEVRALQICSCPRHPPQRSSPSCFRGFPRQTQPPELHLGLGPDEVPDHQPDPPVHAQLRGVQPGEAPLGLHHRDRDHRAPQGDGAHAECHREGHAGTWALRWHWGAGTATRTWSWPFQWLWEERAMIPGVSTLGSISAFDFHLFL